MTCQELHCYLENPLRVEIYMYRESLPAAVVEHLGECTECARLFEEQKGLGISLNMARDATPQMPISLDAKVLANYRRLMEGSGNFGQRRFWSLSSPWLRWGAVATVIALVASAIFLGRDYAPITAKKIAPAAPVVQQQQAPEVSAKEAVVIETPKQEVPGERVRRASTGTNSSPLPPGFASLMYCDELSCAGAMEVIRVELPPAAGQAQGPAASPVMAEVLVGADGIARGIRIVQ